MSYANERNALREVHNALVDRLDDILMRVREATTKEVTSEALVEAAAAKAMKEVCAALRTAIDELRD